jgi:RHS repeat-associated protein
LTVTVTDVSANIATQVVNFTVGTAIGYDANGNQTSGGGWAMTYDRENRLIAASNQQSAISYQYDALGRQTRRQVQTWNAASGSWLLTSDSFFYYAGWQLIAEYDGAGTLQRKYVYGPGIDEPVRMTISQLPSSISYYFHADGLGSITEITGSTGQLVESYRYDVYGTPSFFDSSFIPHNSSLIGNRLLFTGRDRDPDTTWYNYRHRYYNPSLGRFVQPDRFGIKGGDMNLYRYCLNSPANNVDPYGLWSWRQTLGVVITVAAVTAVVVAVAATAGTAGAALPLLAPVLYGAITGGVVGGVSGGGVTGVIGGVVGGAVGGAFFTANPWAAGALGGGLATLVTGLLDDNSMPRITATTAASAGLCGLTGGLGGRLFGDARLWSGANGIITGYGTSMYDRLWVSVTPSAS